MGGGTTASPAADSTGMEMDHPFIVPTDTPSLSTCSVFEQDCPVGQKCTLVATIEGGGWDAWQCVPVADPPVEPGGACMFEGSPGQGLDDCAEGSVCLGVDVDEFPGTCIAFCEGSGTRPECADLGSECYTQADGLIAFCLPRCDPTAPVCPGDMACYPVQSDWFGCAFDVSGAMGVPGDPCSGLGTCDPGAVCMSAAAVPGCMDELGCCSSVCDLGDPTPPCLPGQSCVPFFEDDPPAEYAHVGLCRTP